MRTGVRPCGRESCKVADLLFEIGTEELPSWYPATACADLEQLLGNKLAAAGVSFGQMTTYSTPRRLALLVRDLPETSEKRREKRRGPPKAAAFDQEGKPTRAAAGFAASNGVSVESLTLEDSGKGEYLYATVDLGGESVAALLPPILQQLVRELPAPRKMRWGAVEDAFVRPVAWLLARLGDEVLDVQVAGHTAGGSSRGHRFLADHEVAVPRPADYEAALAEARVIADPEARRKLTAESVADAARSQGLTVMDQPELLDEVTGLVEYPFPITGSFAEHYLELPEEVLTTVLITHQRFFPLRKENGELAPAFVGVSNNKVTDEVVVRRGYEQVLDGRLYDARFFWDSDRQSSLAQHAWGLSGIGYQRELGSMADKVARVANAARAIAGLVGLDEAGLAQLNAAVPLFRADLVTGMVYEFPELEGIMARAYALAEGQPAAVAQVLEEGVLPKGPGSALPESQAGMVLAAADKLEKIIGFVAIGRKPSGSADPFALRRDGIGLARLLNHSGWTASTEELVTAAAGAFAGAIEVTAEHLTDTVQFIQERISALLQEEGLTVPVIRAAGPGSGPVLAASRRAHLLARLAVNPGFTELAALYKRVANIAGQATDGVKVDASLFSEPQEQDLLTAIPAAASGAGHLLDLAADRLDPWDLGSGPGAGLEEASAAISAALTEVISVKQPLDDFLDNVHVLSDDAAVRANRLALLAQVRDALRPLGALEHLDSLKGG